jgi:ubiquinone/menaquinone biosynthesis C-methylase UbiE
MVLSPSDLQRAYYERTANAYDDMHASEGSSHDLYLSIMMSLIEHYKFNSVLDIGSGTGRALAAIKRRSPHVRVLGVEPSGALRKIGYAKGLTRDELIEGDATHLAIGDGAFDLVCEFGALHHICDPSAVVSEMLRVARRALYISDSNNFGQGNLYSRTVKQSINALGLWAFADKIKTRGRGYIYTDGDGISYSYSVFNDVPQITKACSIRFISGADSGKNIYRSSEHVAVFGVKRNDRVAK